MSNAEKMEFRCKGCGKLLAVTDGNANIVCPRCSGMNKLNIQTRKIEFIPRNMRSRKTQTHPHDADTRDIHTYAGCEEKTQMHPQSIDTAKEGWGND